MSHVKNIVPHVGSLIKIGRKIPKIMTLTMGLALHGKIASYTRMKIRLIK